MYFLQFCTISHPEGSSCAAPPALFAAARAWLQELGEVVMMIDTFGNQANLKKHFNLIHVLNKKRSLEVEDIRSLLSIYRGTHGVVK